VGDLKRESLGWKRNMKNDMGQFKEEAAQTEVSKTLKGVGGGEKLQKGKDWTSKVGSLKEQSSGRGRSRPETLVWNESRKL